jgi:hypothetical protein
MQDSGKRSRSKLLLVGGFFGLILVASSVRGGFSGHASGGSQGCEPANDPTSIGARSQVGPGLLAEVAEDDATYILQESGPIDCTPPPAGDVYRRQPAGTGSFTSDSGVAVGDFNGDGASDIVLIGAERLVLLTQTDDGAFTPSPDAIPAELDVALAHGASVVDVDGDLDLDVFVHRLGASNVLLENDGSGRFSNTASTRGLDGPSDHQSISSVWADLDGDNDLDLLVGGFAAPGADSGDPSLLLINDGAGQFSDRSGQLPEHVQEAATFVVGAPDLDQDGLPELYFVNDHDTAMILWNQGDLGFAVDADTSPSGLNAPYSGMGLALGDMNGDGVDDVIVPSWGSISVLFSSDFAGETVWMNYAQASGIMPDTTANQDMGWGADLADLDNDGDLDAVVVFGAMGDDSGQPDAVFRQDEPGKFTSVAAQLGLDDATTGRGLVLADLNRDGWVDLVRPNMEGEALIDLAPCADESWLEVELRAPAPNTRGVGAVVRVTTDASTQRRTVYAGGTGYASGGPPEVHLGLGAAAEVDLEVVWPDGQIARFEGIAARQRVLVERTR